MKQIYKANRKDVEELSSILTDGMLIEVSGDTHKYIDNGKWYDCNYVWINGEETRFTIKLVDKLILHGCISKIRPKSL